MSFKYVVCYMSMVLMLASCAPKSKSERKGVISVDQELAPYFELFKQRAAEHGKNLNISSITIKFEGELGKDASGTSEILGLCTMWREDDESYPEIKIDRTDYALLSNVRREALLFHELGHCLLNRVHDDDTYDDGRPKSLMNKYIIGEYYYSSYYDEYMRELFR